MNEQPNFTSLECQVMPWNDDMCWTLTIMEQLYMKPKKKEDVYQTNVSELLFLKMGILASVPSWVLLEKCLDKTACL